MKIVQIELFHVNIPLKTPFWPTWIPGYPQTHNKFTLIKLLTNEGIEGYAAGIAMSKERQGLGDLLGGYLIGQDPTDITRIQGLLKQASFIGWRNFWIEPACWDIIGKKENKPVYELLGGSKRPIEAYLSTGEMHEPKQRVDELLKMKERGFKTAKVRVKNAELADDIKYIETIRNGLENKIKLAVDANQGWLVSLIKSVPAWDLKRAQEFAAVCAANDIEWLEEPLDYKDYNGNAALKASSKVKIGGAELNDGWDEIKIMFEKDCFDIYQPDATFAGGIFQVKKIIDECKKRNRLFSPHTWTNGIGFHVNWNLMLADKENNHPLEYPMEEPSWIPEFRDGIIDPIIPDNNGMLQPFEKPGLGFTINKKKLKKYGKRFFKLTEKGLKMKTIWEKGFKTALKIKEQKDKT